MIIPPILVNGFFGVQCFIDKFWVALIGDGKLVFKIGKAVIDRCCG